MLTVTHEQYENATTFNITKMIKTEYEKGSPVSLDLFNNLDLSEVSYKKFLYSSSAAIGSFPLEFNETLLTNIVTHLPFEYYKQYINFTWIYCGSNDKQDGHNLTHTLLSSGNFELIKELLTIGQNYLEDQNPQPEYSYSYKRKDDYANLMLKPILDLNYYLGSYSDKECRNPEKQYTLEYKEVFDIAVKQCQTLINKQNKEFHYNRVFNAKSWATPKEYPLLGSFMRNNKGIDAIYDSIVNSPYAFCFFQDVSKQNKNNNPFLNENILKKAFSVGNLDVVYSLNQSFQHDKNYFIDLLNENLSKWQSESEKYFHYSAKDLYEILPLIDKTLLLVNEFQNNPSELDAKNLVYLFMFKHDYDKHYITHEKYYTITNQLINTFPQIQKDKITDNFTLQESLYLYKTFTDFITNNKYRLSSIPYEIALYESLSKIFTLDLEPIPTERKKVINTYTANNIIPLLYEYNNQKTISDFFLMESSLDKKETKSIKLKI